LHPYTCRMLTVSIPVFNTPPDMVRRAVDSVLANDCVERVIVTGDGQSPGIGPDDRVLVWATRRNMGRYFVDDVVSRAISTPFFTVHDADDWSDPGRLDACVAADADVAYTRRVTHSLSGSETIRVPMHRPYGSLDVLWGCMAVYRTGLVRGLWHPGFRVSWDALLDQMVYRFAATRQYVKGVDYHIGRREGSLTQSPATGLRTDYRREVGRLHKGMWATMETLGPDDTRDYLARVTAPTVSLLRDSEVNRLKALL
jgi:cellulose synthase/poly-beta-1,6-N-acetylglucosamine synthase-like glycosyltransferase